MRRFSLPPVWLASLCTASILVAMNTNSLAEEFLYPTAKTVDVVDDYHGTKVVDPYRWLEDVDSDETLAWVEAENEVTFDYLEKLPGREAIEERITKLWNYEKYGTPWRAGERYFFYKNDGLQNQSVLYVQEGLDGAPRVLIDPNTLSDDGTVALGGLSVNEEGTQLAYATSDAGSDWRTWHVRDITTGQDLEDEIRWSKFSGASWMKDGSGFFYSAYDAPKEGDEFEQANYYQKLYFHRIGSSQSEDELVYERPDEKEWGFGGGVTEDGRYLIISVWQGTSQKNRVFYKDLESSGGVVELLPEPDADYSFVGNDAETFFFRTDLDAPRGRLIAVDTRHPERDHWREVIAQGDDVMQSASIVADRLVCSYMHDAHDQIRLYDLGGAFEHEVQLPTLGSVGGFSGKRSDTETFYSFTSFLYPNTIYRYDFATDTSEVFRAPDIDFDATEYATEQVFYSSKDGTKVPMFLIHKRGLVKSGKNPTLLYGYGGFNISITPSFSVSRLVWMEMGGVVAVANLRGGGEYGEDWHQAGMLQNKQNVFDDFIAAGEWLIDQGYTQPEKLACQGGSNGGLLVGAVVNQRPDLWGAALPAVGVMDMLRFHKFTIGWAWVSDYGSSDDAEQFETLYRYSPYHNLTNGTEYPAIMVTTADHDDRVVPGHSFKYAARLQAYQAGDAPVLIRIETRAGHGAGKPTSKRIEEAADAWAFLAANLGMEGPSF
jgi:prolyl oligopeptidase